VDLPEQGSLLDIPPIRLFSAMVPGNLDTKARHMAAWGNCKYRKATVEADILLDMASPEDTLRDKVDVC
jgi:hypothetical protein